MIKFNFSAYAMLLTYKIYLLNEYMTKTGNYPSSSYDWLENEDFYSFLFTIPSKRPFTSLLLLYSQK